MSQIYSVAMTTTAITYNDINRQIQKVAPVLASSYAAYPITFQSWLKPTDKVDDKHPCFVQDEIPPLTPPFESHNLYSDYVWGSINDATGYYHLRTKEAYLILIELLENNVPNIQCECYNGNKKDDIRRAEVIELLRSRLESDIPNDIYILNEIQHSHVDVEKNKSDKGSSSKEEKRHKQYLQQQHHDHKQGHVCSDRLLNVLRSFGSTKFPYGGVTKGI